MSYYTILRRCGHEERIQIRGTNVRGERESRATREATKLCGDCRKAQRDAQRAEVFGRAIAIAEAAGWPALTGTEKQVAWANSIRMDAVAAIVEQVGEQDARPYIEAAMTHTDASWWIDRRGLTQPIRTMVDMVEEPGVARATYGSLLKELGGGPAGPANRYLRNPDRPKEIRSPKE